jgi:hypothetical protein
MITNVGISHVTAASNMGIQINIGGAYFTSQIMSEDRTDLANRTGLPDIIYSVDTSKITYSRIDDDNVLFRINLDTSIGDFNVGGYAIVLTDNTMFSVTAFSGLEAKFKKGPNGQGGNNRYYETIINISNFANIANLTVLINNDTSLPEVDNENSLPDPSSASFSTYFVHNWMGYHGKPALATRFASKWWFYPAYEGSHREQFEDNVGIGSVVYFNAATGKYGLAAPNSAHYSPIGICGIGYELIKLGEYYVSPTARFVPGADYYVSSIGVMTTTYSHSHVGIAISPTVLYVFNLPEANKTVHDALWVASDVNPALIHMINYSYSTDSKIWRYTATDTLFNIETVNDAYNASSTAISVRRAGNVIEQVSQYTSYGSFTELRGSTFTASGTGANMTIGDNNITSYTTRCNFTMIGGLASTYGENVTFDTATTHMGLYTNYMIVNNTKGGRIILNGDIAGVYGTNSSVEATINSTAMNAPSSSPYLSSGTPTI